MVNGRRPFRSCTVASTSTAGQGASISVNDLQDANGTWSYPAFVDLIGHVGSAASAPPPHTTQPWTKPLRGMLAHELTQPLTAITLTTALLLEEAQENTPEAQREDLLAVQDGVSRMTGIIRNLTRSGQVHPDPANSAPPKSPITMATCKAKESRSEPVRVRAKLRSRLSNNARNQ